MNASNSLRYPILAFLLMAFPVMISLRLVQIQLQPEAVQQFMKVMDDFSYLSRSITPARGQIYDRWGNLLAGNQTVYEVNLELGEIKDPHTVALTLSTILGLDYNDVFVEASKEATEDIRNITVAKFVSSEKGELLRSVIEQTQKMLEDKGTGPNLAGVHLVPSLMRIYPEKSLASNVLGFVSLEGIGYFGVEGRYNELLAGRTVNVRVPTDPRVIDLPEIPPGADLVLTIDRSIQRAMEKLADRAMEQNGARSATIVVMDPRNNEVLAMATTRRMNLNDVSQYSKTYEEKEIAFNPAIGTTYEPGSVFKPLTMGIALEVGAVTENTEFLDTGSITVGGHTINNWDRGAWGPQSMQGCLQHSLNVCLAWVATQIGAERFYAGLQAFGIGHLTGIDLAGEESGDLKLPGDDNYSDAELGTNSFGQGVSVTPIQMATAISAIANDGKIYAPHVVRSIVDGGYQRDVDRYLVSMPISAETAHRLSEMLARSLEIESSAALVTGYRVAGKTGTGEISIPGLGYTTNQTNASFVGWGPVDDPRFLVFVWLERPTSSPWGSVVAAPVFREAVETLVVLMNLPPDDIRLQLQAQAH